MSMQDPIADMLTRIRNGLSAHKTTVSMPLSKKKKAIADLLVAEGFIKSVNVSEENNGTLSVELKYHQGQPVIEMLKRVSRPGLRIYKTASELPKVHGGFGVAVISTSKGLMSDRKARSEGVGGEIICYVA
ncbi:MULTISPECIES: 30S ribosomal protein S8 [Cysteiniphilum]|uniref:Small ribosomal subunit protein uS8 n=1 Tax=Cysteiniphilum litorale TaxID=2056700 RepID=A0A8J2Z2F2_9GAMM|nr:MULTISPECIES: 30S ribosomal protein S8 [Cysteiniphilum]GGF89129.1 30S ribosomal protein S8 [Cysteiniphilum litorale]